MKLTEVFEESVIVLRTNRLRTALSILGIVIGIGSVITLMTLGQASQASIKQRIESLGANLLTIRPGSQQEGFLRGGSGGGTTLTLADAYAIRDSQRITTIDKVAADYSSRAQLSYGSENTNTQVAGVDTNYFDVRNIKLASGTAITEQDDLVQNKVAVLGPNVVDDLFGSNTDPVGKRIRINGDTYTVIGTIESASFGTDDTAFIPLSTAQHALFGVNYLSTIYVTAKSENDMSAAQNQLGYFLLERHGISTPTDADFSITSQEDIISTVSEVTGTFTTLLTGIAAISLVVGGIGIMNIMLVTVTERTREIGIRKALGAKRKTIISQFLVEAILLTLVGGILGIAIGLSLSYFLTTRLSLPQVFSLDSVLLAFGVSAVIGIVFGWYPAQKASKLQPIEALRYE